MTTNLVEKLTETSAVELLRKKFGQEGYTVLPQVGDKTGGARGRTIDALMIQTWPSKGLSLTGVEYKRSLSDWRRELAQPEKADAFIQMCNFWVILAPKGLIQTAEIPEAWGHWEIGADGKLYRTRHPRKNGDAPETYGLSWWAAILRAVERYDPSAAAIARARQEGYDAGVKSGKEIMNRRQREADDLVANVRKFEEASGLRIARGWQNERLGKRLAAYLEHGQDEFGHQLERLADNADRIAHAIREVLGEE